MGHLLTYLLTITSKVIYNGILPMFLFRGSHYFNNNKHGFVLRLDIALSNYVFCVSFVEILQEFSYKIH